MPCFAPVNVPKRGFTDLRVTVACGRCIGCRMDRVRDTATRCVHESKLHAYSCMVTLTYDDEHLPRGGSLYPPHFVAFMKALRYARSSVVGGRRVYSPIRFLQAGEYGSRLLRPHHHALLFGVRFPDQKLKPGSLEKGKPCWYSEELADLWGQGRRCQIDVLNSRTAAYSVGYVLKKITGDLAADHYRRVDPDTGEIFDLHPEYSTRSNRPGLGAGFFERYREDIFRGDFCATIDGGQNPVPPYYDKLLQRDDPERYERIKAQRLAYAMRPEHRANSTPARLAVREEVKRARLSLRRAVF